MPARYFWRRVGAFLIDYVLAALVSLGVLWPFLGNTDALRLDQDLAFSATCYDVTGVPPAWLDILGAHRLDSAIVCDGRVMGIPNGMTATLFFDGETEGLITSQSNLSFPVDQDGNPVTPVFPQGLILNGLLVLVGGTMLARSGMTPGKRLLGLKVVAEGGPVRGMLREAIKFAPWLLQGLFGLLYVFAAPWALPLLAQIGSPTGLAVMAVMFLGLVWFYVWPLIRWRGAARYDRWLGLSVLRR